MIVQPNSIVQLFGDMRLNPDYSDTLYFDSVVKKDEYFANYVKYTVSELTYVRLKNENKIRIEMPIKNAYNVCYMRFKNTAFENKWFYAFVTMVDYINPETVEITYTIDVIMTWMGVFTLEECFIERQHTIRDGIGNNICDEGLDTGPYVTEGKSITAFFGEYDICFFVAGGSEGNSQGNFLGGIYSGLSIVVAKNASIANNFIKEITDAGRSNDIVAIVMLPSHYVSDASTQQPLAEPVTDQFTVDKPYLNIGGYVPRNNKLFCYPYKLLTVDNTEGTAIEYMYEYFNGLPDSTSTGVCQFEIDGSANVVTEIFCTPKNYKGEAKNFSEKISMDKFPMCAWVSDTFRAYVAQQKSSLPSSILSAAITGGVAMAGGGTFALGGAVANIADLLGKTVFRPAVPNTVKGSQSNNLAVGLKEKNFIFTKKCITVNYAKMLDSFFDMYGYAVRQHGVPNMNARPNWTYVKTQGCSVGGDIPADAMLKISELFDNGIRFWKTHGSIGNYSLSNPGVV